MLNARQIVEATGGSPMSGHPNQPFRAIATDTRTLQEGDLFVPLKGETFDGHDHVQKAIAAGAAGFLWEEDRPDPAFDWPESTVVITVPDTLKAYGEIARYWRRLVNCLVVAVTGSSGKTSTKEFLAETLRRNWRVVKTEANYNNEVGVPRTLLELRPGDQIAVVEMGMRGPGQIAYLAEIAEPDIGVITSIGPAHLELLGSMENIVTAKWELADYLEESGGQLVIPGDDVNLRGMGGAFPHDRLHYSSLDPANDWAELVATEQWLEDGRQRFRYRDRQGTTRTATISLPGEHQVSNALLSILTGKVLGMPLPAELPILPSPLMGRGEELKLKEVTFINEAYNANPSSMTVTLQTFAKLHGRKVAVLGEMRELGPTSAELHRGVGTEFAKLPIDMLVTVGYGARAIAEAAIEGGFPSHGVRQADDSAAAAAILLKELLPGDQVLLKASRGVRLEDILIEVRQAWEPPSA
jgi:UDP-N-acetylmuramoyl-tripeptide--D-alanyl-D-alanine ligase